MAPKRKPARRLEITQAISDPKLFGGYFKSSTWDAWRVFLAALFGLPLTHDQLLVYQQFTGRSTPPKSPLQEAWLVVGRRGGKSFVLAVVAVFLACFKDWRPYLGPGEVGTIMIIAKDRAQARSIKNFISGVLRETPMLAPMLVDETAEAIRLRNRIRIEIHAASYRSTRGYTIVAALLDEVAIWPTDDSAEPDAEIVNAIKPGMATIPGAMLLCASSPHARRGVLWEAYRKHFGQEDDPVLVWQAPTRAMNPSVPQAYIDAHYADDPAKAAAEYGAQFRTDVETFISREAVEACVATGRYELPRIDNVLYLGGIDTSGGSCDSMVLSINHVEGGDHVVCDAIREVRPPFSPDAVVAEFAALYKSYGVHEVWGDRYAGEWPRERLRMHNIEYRIDGKSKSEFFLEFLPVLNSRRVELLDHARLVTQLCQLERTVGSARDAIKKPPSGHDDIANAVAIAAVMGLKIAAIAACEPPIVDIFVAGTPRYYPGSSEFTGSGVSSSAPAASYDYNREQSWKNFVNADGSISMRPRGGWGFP
jgi:hypothetical protein